MDPDRLANDIVQVVTALTALIAAFGSVIAAILSYYNGKKADTNSKKLDENTAITKEVHTATNGKLGEMVEAVKQVAANAQVDSAAARQAVVDTQAVIRETKPLGDPSKEAI